MTADLERLGEPQHLKANIHCLFVFKKFSEFVWFSLWLRHSCSFLLIAIARSFGFNWLHSLRVSGGTKICNMQRRSEIKGLSELLKYPIQKKNKQKSYRRRRGVKIRSSSPHFLQNIERRTLTHFPVALAVVNELPSVSQGHALTSASCVSVLD